MLGKDLVIKQLLKKQLDQLPPEERAKAEAAMEDEGFMAKVQEIVEQLSPEEQKELMQAMMTGNLTSAQAILRDKLP